MAKDQIAGMLKAIKKVTEKASVTQISQTQQRPNSLGVTQPKIPKGR